MKWSEPAFGTRRTRIIFAWHPIICDDGFKRWTCQLQIVEEFNGRWIRVSAMPLEKSR